MVAARNFHRVRPRFFGLPDDSAPPTRELERLGAGSGFAVWHISHARAADLLMYVQMAHVHSAAAAGGASGGAGVDAVDHLGVPGNWVSQFKDQRT